MSAPTTAKIHVTLPSDIHRRLRVQVALDDTTIQTFVEKLVASAVSGVRLPEDEK